MVNRKDLVLKIMPKVTVNWNRCSGKGTCVEVCPTSVFELQEIKEHPETLKAVPVRMEECTLCMKCVPACIEDAITIEKGEETS
jgi:NAD-dependent dihydropyrimidine dehydrogenase PreA subunit